MKKPENRNVFVNCPFDENYRDCFEALIFTIAASGYRVKCALEDGDGARVRLDKLVSLITASDRSVHDLSWATVPEGDPARYNMPFELGLMVGSKSWGGVRQRRKTTLVLVEKKHGLAPYLSDLAGVDPQEHRFDPNLIIQKVRGYLHHYPSGGLLPGVRHYRDLLDEFKTDLPEILTSARLSVDEADPISSYRNYIDLLTGFLEIVEGIAQPKG
ncbi:MAG: hypothetical protein AAFV54_14300 [Pseudomonadota bacterium]